MLRKVKNIFKKPMTLVTIIGVACVPALYNISFLTSMWDPYGRLDQLPVAVINQDQSASFQDKTLTIGDDMVDNMKESKSLDFHFVSEKDAEKGLEEGDYYMVITLPEDLSEKATSLLTNQPEPITISYQTSKGHSFVASKMGESAMEKLKTSVSETITETYTTAVFDSMREIQTGMVEAADGSQQLTNGASQLESGSQTLSNGLTTLTTSGQALLTGANQLATGLVSYTDGVNQAATGSQTLSSGLTTYTNGVASLASGAEQLNANSSQLIAGVGQLQSGASQVEQLVTGANQLQAGLEQLASSTSLSAEQSSQIQALLTGLPQLQAAIGQLNDSLSSIGGLAVDTSTLSSLLTEMGAQAQGLLTAVQTDKTASIEALQATATYQNLPADQQAELVGALQNSPSTTATVAQTILDQLSQLSQTLSSLQSLSGMATQMNQLQSAVGQINTVANQALPGATTAIENLSSGLNQVNTALNQQILPGTQTLTSGVSQLQRQLSSGASQLMSGVTAYTAGVAQLAAGVAQLVANNSSIQSGGDQLTSGLATLASNSGQLVSGSGQLALGSQQLIAGADQLASGGKTLTSGITSLRTGSETLTNSLSSASQQLSVVSVEDKNAQAVSQPVTLEHSDQDEVKTNGVGMAPYMVSVALMVAALSANVIFVKHIDNRSYKNRWDWAKGKLLLNGIIASLAAVILYGVLRLIGIESAHPMATLGLILLASWTFMALVTALVGWNNRFGSFASLIILLLQLGSSAGTYPIELSPRFFQIIQPYLPMTYSVSGFRQTISMVGNSSHQVWMLSLFLVGFMGFGLLIYNQKDE
ncbi:TPA: YhgE/Pip domain-containing protein [Streptococcus suis]|uniref:YhgE/Pip domain-containing protein n=1 Tax=Streptococcus suis TaxID=1307 RepID=A0AAP6A7G0_STRSU|nr:YhgE/Pip domain-containing protein [Streptococcus suis]MCB2908857.1 YhgE/Pip domain-containing protein [Streptococcus suis]MCO0826240.1 YhgE/Pip domain-containing protein [Streptococcus suis]MCO0828286.1 YhgE/Pip domain-containing protein [Streptococcus suis]MCO0846875.1 YhgE/Pip domain-containing protein [Streptococcus suis]MCO0854369.1 YhgE/Pip domain-containing protein [Streptococcus suis]